MKPGQFGIHGFPLLGSASGGSTRAYPVSSNQQRYILASLGSNANYHLPVSFRIRGPLDVDRLQRSIHEVVRSQPGLNVSFRRTSQGEFVNVPHDRSVARIQRLKLPTANQDAIKAKAAAWFYQSRNILKEDLCRFQIIELGTQDYCFTLSLHHAIADGVTIGLFLHQLSECYDGKTIERIDASAQQSYFQVIQSYGLLPGQWSERESQFWRNHFANTTDLADLPPNYSGDGGAERTAVHRQVDAGVFQQIRQQAAQLQVTSFHFVYGVYLLALARYTGNNQIVSAFQSSGRHGKPEAQQTLGMFSNALGLKMEIDPDSSYRELVRQLRDRVSACLEHERYPYHESIQQTGVHPKFGINWYPRYEGLHLAGVDSEQIELLEWQSDFDLNLHCLTNGGQLTLSLHYDSTRFDPGRMSLFVEQIENALHQVCTNPATQVEAIRLTTSADRRLPDPTISWPSGGTPGTIHERFFESVDQHPHQPALWDVNGAITYSQLADRVNDLASELGSQGVAPGARVAILARRNPAVVVAMMSVLKSGGAFAVLDMDYPEERLRHCCEVLQPDFLITAWNDGESSPLAVDFPANRLISLSTQGQISQRPNQFCPKLHQAPTEYRRRHGLLPVHVRHHGYSAMRAARSSPAVALRRMARDNARSGRTRPVRDDEWLEPRSDPARHLCAPSPRCLLLHPLRLHHEAPRRSVGVA